MNNSNNNMNSQTLILNKVLLTLALVLFSFTSIASERIFVFNGEIKILEVGAIDRVAVGNAKLISTSMLDNGQLLLLAEGVGETTVHIWYKDGSESNLEVSILPNDAERIMNEVQTLVNNVGEIEVKKVGERLYLIGSVYKSSLPELDLIKGAYKEVIDLTKKLNDPLPPTVIPDDKMVFMNVKFAELRGGLDKNLGVAWDQVIAGPVAGVNYDAVDNEVFRAEDPNNAPSFAATATLGVQNAGPLGFLGLATQINSAINLLVATSNAVILAEPTLSARSGGKAEFLAGGEIPVVTSGSLGSTDVEYKEFGIKLEIEPIVGFDDTIVAKIVTESSTIDPSRPGGGNTPPGFITRRTSTDIRMNDNETLILSGLVDRNLSESITKFPFLGDIPIIGAFFRNTITDNNDNDLVIFVTPTVFDANSDINKNEINKREEMINTFKKNTGQEDLIID